MRNPTHQCGLPDFADKCAPLRTRSGQEKKPKRGHERADGLVFWNVTRGKQVWLTLEAFEIRQANHLAYNQKWRSENKARNCELVKEWRKRNPDRAREILRKAQSAYVANKPEKRRDKDNRRRAIKKSSIATDHDTDIADVLEIMRDRLTKCTGIVWHLDHVMPLSAGGKHAHWNLQVLPAAWNIWKKADPKFQLPDCYRMPT